MSAALFFTEVSAAWTGANERSTGAVQQQLCVIFWNNKLGVNVTQREGGVTTSATLPIL